MPSIGPLEILVVAVIALLVFGPEKLPQIAKQIGRAAAEFKRMATDVKDEFDSEFDHAAEEETRSARRSRAENERTARGSRNRNQSRSVHDPPDHPSDLEDEGS